MGAPKAPPGRPAGPVGGKAPPPPPPSGTRPGAPKSGAPVGAPKSGAPKSGKPVGPPRSQPAVPTPLPAEDENESTVSGGILALDAIMATVAIAFAVLIYLKL